MKRDTLQVLLVVSMAGFIVNIMAHISTFFGGEPSLEFLGVWAMLIGVIALLAQPSSVRNLSVNDGAPDDFWTSAMKEAPSWVKILLILLMGYETCSLFYWIWVREYINFGPRVVSGYSMVFYLAVAGSLFSKLKNQK